MDGDARFQAGDIPHVGGNGRRDADGRDINIGARYSDTDDKG